MMPEPDGYAAFISYKTSCSKRQARRVRRSLYSLSRRHRGEDEPPLRIFLDVESLPAGDLDAAIVAALQKSANLIVLIGDETKASPWVDREIRVWRETHPDSLDRLFMVRASKDINLSWKDGEFEEPEKLPAQLRTAFDTEQKWFDAPGGLLGLNSDSLAGLYTRVAEVDPERLKIQEAAFQRRRRLNLSIITTILCLLLILTSFAAIAAQRNSVEAERQRNEAQRSATEARAEADAAQAVLSISNSFPSAVALAVKASRASSSPNVRSAMMSISNESRRLTRAFTFPTGEAGSPPSSVTFSKDGKRLIAWSTAGDGSSYLQVWLVDSSTTVFSGRVEVPAFTEIVQVRPNLLLACSALGPVRLGITKTTATVERLDTESSEEDDRRCALTEFGGGAIALSTPSPGLQTPSLAHFVSSKGKTTSYGGVSSVVARPDGRSAVLAGRSGITVVSPESSYVASKVAALKAEAMDANGNFLVQVSRLEWRYLTFAGKTYTGKSLRVPADVVDVTPILYYGRFTGRLAWIRADGLVGWSVDNRSIRLRQGLRDNYSTIFPPRVEPMNQGSVLAVFKNTATVLRPPDSEGTSIPRPNDLPQADEHQWGGRTVQARLGAGRPDDEPIFSRCADFQKVLLRTDGSLVEAVAVDEEASATEVTKVGGIATDCSIIDVGNSLSVLRGKDSSGTPVKLRANAVADHFALSATGDKVAVLRRNSPIEVLATGIDEGLPRPWNTTSSYTDIATAALGERRLSLTTNRLRITDQAGKISNLPGPERGDVVAVRPDGDGVVAETITAGKSSGEFVGKAGRHPTNPACAPARITYQPAAGFESSVAAAEAQLPVATSSTGQLLDCRPDAPAPVPLQRTILSYQIGTSVGQLVTQDEQGKVFITRWQRGREDSISTSPGPVITAEDRLTVAASGTEAATFTSGSHEVAKQQLVNGRWVTSLSVISELPDVAAAALVDNSTILAVVAGNGGFELYDAATGRRLAIDLRAITIETEKVTALDTAIVGDSLYLYLRKGKLITSSDIVDLPIGINALRRQLCELYRADGC